MKRTPQAKSQAAILVREMKAAGTPIKHQQALEMVAKMSGFRDWNAMAAAPEVTEAAVQAAPATPDSADSRTLRKLVHLSWDLINTCDNTGCDGLTVANEEEADALKDFLNDLETPAAYDSCMARFDPKTQIAIIWSAYDVLSIRQDLTLSEAMDVLTKCKYKHDADNGITWDILGETADWFFKKRELTGTVEFVDEAGNDCSKPAVVKLASHGRVYVEGQPLSTFSPDNDGEFKVDGFGDEGFSILNGRLFGSSDNEGNIQDEDIRDLLEQLEKANALPSIKKH